MRVFKEAVAAGKLTVTFFRCHVETILEEIEVLREQLEVATDRAQSWKNLCERYKELSEARGEALDLQRQKGSSQ